MRFEGDRSIKNEVIARYLTADTTGNGQEAETLAITPANYKFKYKGQMESDGLEVRLHDLRDCCLDRIRRYQRADRRSRLDVRIDGLAQRLLLVERPLERLVLVRQVERVAVAVEEFQQQ